MTYVQINLNIASVISSFKDSRGQIYNYIFLFGSQLHLHLHIVHRVISFIKFIINLKKNSTRNKVDGHNREHAHEFKYLNFSLQNIKRNRIDPLFCLQNINEKATSIYKLY